MNELHYKKTSVLVRHSGWTVYSTVYRAHLYTHTVPAPHHQGHFKPSERGSLEEVGEENSCVSIYKRGTG